MNRQASSQLVSLSGLSLLQQLRAENIPQLLHDVLSRAMARNQMVRGAVGDEAHGLLKSIRRCFQQMQATDNRVHSVDPDTVRA